MSRPAGDHPRPILTIDVVLLTMDEDGLKVVVLKRDQEPFKVTEALIGGYVHGGCDRDDMDAVARVLRKKTSISGIYIEQLKTFASANRDPRGWAASIAYIALAPIEVVREASKNYPLEIYAIDEVKGLAFDHDDIVSFALKRLRGK